MIEYKLLCVRKIVLTRIKGNNRLKFIIYTGKLSCIKIYIKNKENNNKNKIVSSIGKNLIINYNNKFSDKHRNSNSGSRIIIKQQNTNKEEIITMTVRPTN